MNNGRTKVALIAFGLFLWSASAEAQTITQTASFVLTWSDNSGQNPKTDDQEDGFRVERRLGQAGSPSLAATVGQNVTTHTDVIQKDDGGNEYCYQVFAFNKIATSPGSNTACATTPKITTGPITPVIKSISVSVTVNIQ